MSDQDEDDVSGRVVRLEIENFKSYRGFHNIGPFKGFTAVIGPNGSGKSNLMDAISFVLGVKTAQLRGSLKELLFSNSAGTDAMDRPRKGHVKLVYESTDGTETHFTRVIAPASNSADATFQSQYKLNSKAVSWEAYNKQLKSFNILVKARNFLVFQGDIESYAAMSPKELTDRFEHISGSEAHRKQYHELEQQKLKAEEQTSFLFSKRKGVTQEKKQKKEQKEEAEKHVRMQEELDIAKGQKSLEKEEKEQAAAARSGMVVEKQIEDKKKEHAGCNLQRVKLERQLKRKRTDADQKNPDAVALKEDMRRSRTRLKLAQQNKKQAEQEQEQQHSRVAKLEQDLERVSAAQNQLEEEMQQQEEQGLLLRGPQLAEFSRLEAEANARTSKTKALLDPLGTTQKADEDALHDLQSTNEGLTSRLQQLESDKARCQRHHDELVMQINECKSELHDKKKERGAVSDSNRKSGAQRDHLQKKLYDGEQRLQEAKADRKENERDRKMREAVTNMKRLFPGVHGQVTELSKVSQRKYNIAVSLALGKEMDSVIVDNDKTCKECIDYLKDQRVPPMTFIPLSTVKAQPTNDRLRQLGGSAKLVIDMLQFDKHLERAFRHVCGNTLVCDSTQEGKKLSWGQGGERHKVATVDGTLFAKAGAITGGIVSDMSARAQRWDDTAYESLKQEVAQAQKQLELLPNERECRQEEERLTAELQGLEKNLSYKELDLTATLDKQQKYDAEVETLSTEVQQRVPELKAMEHGIQERQQKMAGLEKTINDVKDSIYAPLSKQLGVKSVRKELEAASSNTEGFNKKKMELNTQASKIKHTLSYENNASQLKADKMKELESEVASHQAKLQKGEKQEAAGRQTRQAQEAELDEQAKQVQELQRQASEIEVEIRALKQAATKRQQQGAAVTRAFKSQKAALDALRTKRADLLGDAAMEQVQLPRADEDGIEDMDTEQQLQQATSSDQVQLDYSSLGREHKAGSSGKEHDRLSKQFKDDIEERAALLAKVAPNLKAMEQYEAVKEREKGSAEELEAAKQEAQSVTEAFNTVRQARFDAFMDAFTHISGVIDRIFKDLTKSSVHPMGGQAYLSLENSEDPFLHGIKFTAMPPSKRFREMEQLSGGEKTVAALALLFAIHTYQPSPFFVLDEIDAALDASNVARVANYIREKTRESAHGSFQSIVISLKDNFFEKADALVGVCRDGDLGCSATLTFDLSRFEE